MYFYHKKVYGTIGIVRKTFRLRTVFLLQTLMPPSYCRNIIVTSGINGGATIRVPKNACKITGIMHARLEYHFVNVDLNEKEATVETVTS